MIGTIECFSCGNKNSFTDRVGLRDECEKCQGDLHACRNCHFYDEGSYNECRESSADVVRDKERANFCDYFQAAQGQFIKDEKDKLMAQAEALFKKK